jgi:transposase
MGRVVIGMDPHKRSVTIEVMDADETVLSGARYPTEKAGYRAMLEHVRQWPQRVWAIEGCNGIGRHVANRLLADGEDVVDVPPKLSARARVFATVRAARPTPPTRTPSRWSGPGWPGCAPVVEDEQLAMLRILADRRRSLGRTTRG